MKDKILEEVIEWYNSHDDKNNIFIDNFFELYFIIFDHWR